MAVDDGPHWTPPPGFYEADFPRQDGSACLLCGRWHRRFIPVQISGALRAAIAEQGPDEHRGRPADRPVLQRLSRQALQDILGGHRLLSRHTLVCDEDGQRVRLWPTLPERQPRTPSHILDRCRADAS